MPKVELFPRRNISEPLIPAKGISTKSPVGGHSSVWASARHDDWVDAQLVRGDMVVVLYTSSLPLSLRCGLSDTEELSIASISKKRVFGFQDSTSSGGES